MNKYTGEVDVKLGNKSYKLIYDWRAISEFQSRFGKDANLNDFSIDQIAETLLIGLKKYHESDVTLEDIFDASPAMGYVSDCIIEAFVYSQHGPEKGAEIIKDAKKLDEDIKKKITSKKA
jgi:hypothetical protein